MLKEISRPKACLTAQVDTSSALKEQDPRTLRLVVLASIVQWRQIIVIDKVYTDLQFLALLAVFFSIFLSSCLLPIVLFSLFAICFFCIGCITLLLFLELFLVFLEFFILFGVIFQP